MIRKMKGSTVSIFCHNDECGLSVKKRPFCAFQTVILQGFKNSSIYFTNRCK